MVDNFALWPILLALLLSMAWTSFVHAQLSSTAAWSNFGHDMANTRRSDFVGPSATNIGQQLDYITYSQSNVGTLAVDSDGTAYFGTAGCLPFCNLIAFTASWTVKWNHQMPSGTVYGFQSSIAIGNDGTLFVGCGDGNLYAFNKSTGAIKWTFPTGGAINSSPNIGPDNTIYFGSNDNNTYAINGLTGKLKWSYSTRGPINSSPAIGSDDIIYIGSGDGNLYALNGNEDHENNTTTPYQNKTSTNTSKHIKT